MNLESFPWLHRCFIAFNWGIIMPFLSSKEGEDNTPLEISH